MNDGRTDFGNQEERASSVPGGRIATDECPKLFVLLKRK